MNDDKLRRAAILIASLDSQSADRLLDEMSPEEAARVRHAVMELDTIDPYEQSQVIREFVRRTQHDSPAESEGVELDPSLARKLGATAPHGDGVAAPRATPPPPRAFAFLDAVSCEYLARLLVREHPQTAAIVVAHLAPSRAAEVLRHLPAPLQTEAICRIARLQPPDPEVIRDIEQEMRALLGKQELSEPLESEGLAAVEAILRAGSPDERRDWMGEVARRDQTLARRLGAVCALAGSRSEPEPEATRGPRDEDARPRTTRPPGIAGRESDPGTRDPAGTPRGLEFADLEQLDPAALALVLQASHPTTTLLALAGASPELMRRITEYMPSREAAQWQRQMSRLGPLRLDDVRRAQLRLAQSAQRLVDQGRIDSPLARRFAVAV
jgi:flagellar motor switch protein FliG